MADVHARSWQAAYRNLLPDDVIQPVVDGRTARAKRMRAVLIDANDPHHMFVALADETVIGMAVTGPSRDPDATPSAGELEAIYLAPEALGRGIGRAAP